MIPALLILLAALTGSARSAPSPGPQPNAALVQSESGDFDQAFADALKLEAQKLPNSEGPLRVAIGDFGHGTEKKLTPFASVVTGVLSTALRASDKFDEYSRKELEQVYGELERSVSDMYTRTEDGPEAGNLTVVQGIFTGQYRLDGESVVVNFQLIEVQTSKVMLSASLTHALREDQISLVEPPVMDLLEETLGKLASDEETLDTIKGELRDLDGVVENWAEKAQENVDEGTETLVGWFSGLVRVLGVLAGLFTLLVIWLVASGRFKRIINWINE